ncbi:MAG: hypothetical protein ACUVWR_09170 [Anaerolineae bacterium]
MLSERASASYHGALRQARLLTPIEQLRLLEELATLIRREIGSYKRRSILELEGLGQEIWAGIDAQECVDKERASPNSTSEHPTQSR